MSEGILDSMVSMYAAATPMVLGRVAPLLVPLYVSFFTVQFGWDLVRWNFAGNDDWFVRAARKLLVFLVTLGLLITLPLWLPRILSGWAHLAEVATGLPGLSPSAIFEQGLALALSMFDSWGKYISLVIPQIAGLRLLAALVIIASFGAAAVQLARILIEATLALGGLVILLAFAGFSATFGVAEGYLRYVFGLGVRAFVVYLVLGVGRDLGVIWEEMLTVLSPIPSLGIHLTIVLASVLFALLVWTLPKTISHHVSSGISFSGLNPMGDHA